MVTASTRLPLVVDLDGTLTTTDTLFESVFKLLKKNPLYLVMVLVGLFKGRAALKSLIADRIRLAPELLPYRQDLLDYLRQQKQQGRLIVLATAAHRSIAQAVFDHLGVFDRFIASDRSVNLKSHAKLLAIQQNVGAQFVYAGDSKADLPIWQAASGAILAGASASIVHAVRQMTPVEREFTGQAAGPKVWLKALRVHQWMKNLLLFVPLMTAFQIGNIDKLVAVAWAFLAFCCAASGTYIVNDLLDIDNDRQHPRKCRRPFAAGQLSIVQGVAAALLLLVLAIGLAMQVSAAFVLALLVYLMLTTAYSWWFKERVLIDVLMLSLLYTLRIVAGGIAAHEFVSSWLLAFSVFIFLSLALVKRCAELVSLQGRGLDASHGRDYRVGDLIVLWPFGVGTAVAAVVVFGLFINADDTQSRYGTPYLLWLDEIVLIYWLASLWLQTARGQMHDDPVVHAVKNPGSRITIIVMVGLMMSAHFLHLGLG